MTEQGSQFFELITLFFQPFCCEVQEVWHNAEYLGDELECSFQLIRRLSTHFNCDIQILDSAIQILLIVTYKGIASGTTTITHDSDGSKNMSVAFSIDMVKDSWTPGAISVSGKSMALTAIPRSSTISCSTAYIGSNATITINRASSSFTHTVDYQFGSLSGNITTKTSNTSISFALPEAFYAQIPNAQSGSGTITCKTYNGSTLIGTNTCTFWAKCDESECKPTLSRGAYDSNYVTKNNNTYSNTITVSGLSYLNAYTFQVRAVDKLATVESNEQTRKTTPIFDWGKDDFNINGTLKINNQNIIDIIYPIGSIYMSVNATNPETLFGGTWTQLKDRFLLGAGSTYTNGSTGGEASHTLTVNEIPSHSHGHYVTVSSGGSLSANCDYDSYVSGKARKSSQNVSTDTTGGGNSHNNMPPYLAVYMWKRTA